MQDMNVKLSSFDFLGIKINSKDSVRVNLTVLPDMQKQSYTYDVNKTSISTATFSVKVSEDTKQILIVFQKIGHFSSDQLIASTIFQADDFSKCFNKNNNFKCTQKVDILEPIQQVLDNNKFHNKKSSKRKVVGSMIAEFSLNNKSSRKIMKILNDELKIDNKRDIN